MGQILENASKTLGTTDLQTLLDQMDKHTPPELIEFFQSCAEIVFSIEVKTSWWNWEAFAVAMIGLIQVVAGAALLFLSAGAALQIGNALISEGIADMIYATQAGLTGTFSWKEWGIQKAISMVLSIVTAGIGAYMSRGAQAAKIGVGLTTRLVVKAVAKKVLSEILKEALMAAISFGTDQLAELITKALFDACKNDFRKWVYQNTFAQNSIRDCEKELTRTLR
eukprot:TRINITY_DN2158_c0_g1_i1.p1 TRINITY_DN2158_c0_g1~~TRINITY_DN2158_c0_g1_i1.p1  ORF type:complete len:224 (-),score=50.17 TRINITY_DN2158_c0_g1_i1:4-675(-)